MGNKSVRDIFAPFAQEILFVAGTPQDLTEAIYNVDLVRSGVAAKILVLGQRINYTIHEGGTPSSTIGFPAFPYDVIELETPDELANFKAVSLTTTAQLQVTYLR